MLHLLLIGIILLRHGRIVLVQLRWLKESLLLLVLVCSKGRSRSPLHVNLIHVDLFESSTLIILTVHGIILLLSQLIVEHFLLLLVLLLLSLFVLHLIIHELFASRLHEASSDRRTLSLRLTELLQVVRLLLLLSSPFIHVVKK